MSERTPTGFEEAGADRQRGIVAEFYEFLKFNKKFWLIPLLIVLFGMGLLIVLGGTTAAPFIYTLF